MPIPVILLREYINGHNESIFAYPSTKAGLDEARSDLRKMRDEMMDEVYAGMGEPEIDTADHVYIDSQWEAIIYHSDGAEGHYTGG